MLRYWVQRLYSIKVEPYWNVKEVAFVHALDTEAIKVEPYWNVKNRSQATPAETQEIKVEPYWNYIDSYVKIVL